MSPTGQRGETVRVGSSAASKALVLATAVYFYIGLAMGGPGDAMVFPGLAMAFKTL
jgi:hypothetical protein